MLQQDSHHAELGTSVSLADAHKAVSAIDVRALSTRLKGAKVVGIGEATHGTSEFHLFRARVIQELVEHESCRLIALEAGWAESLQLQQYLHEGFGDPEASVAGLGFWMWNVLEFRYLVDWIRSFNEVRPESDRVRLVGVDFPSGAESTKRLAAAIGDYPEIRTPEVDTLLASFSAMTPYEAPTDQAEATLLKLGLMDLAEAIRSSSMDEHSHDIAVTAIRGLQLVDQRRRATENSKNWNLRDAAMASNLIRERDSLNPAGPVVVLAHNAHVGRDARGLFSPDLRSMGMHLSDHYGEGYVSIGQFFGQGSLQALVPVGSGTYRLSQVTVGPPPNSSLEAEICKHTKQLPGWVETSGIEFHSDDDGMSLVRECGAAYSDEDDLLVSIDVPAMHDILVFFPMTNRAHPATTEVVERRVIA